MTDLLTYTHMIAQLTVVTIISSKYFYDIENKITIKMIKCKTSLKINKLTFDS